MAFNNVYIFNLFTEDIESKIWSCPRERERQKVSCIIRNSLGIKKMFTFHNVGRATSRTSQIMLLVPKLDAPEGEKSSSNIYLNENKHSPARWYAFATHSSRTRWFIKFLCFFWFPFTNFSELAGTAWELVETANSNFSRTHQKWRKLNSTPIEPFISNSWLLRGGNSGEIIFLKN